MSLSSVAYTTNPTVERVTRQALLERFLRETGLGWYGTVTSGSTTTLVDTTKLLSLQYDDKDWENGWMRISYDAGGAAGAPEGTIRTISDYAPSTGTLTIATMTAPAAGDKYELWKYPHPQNVLDTLDNFLKNEVWLPYWNVLSELPDYDMEQSGVTDFTASNATLTKQTGDPQTSGKQRLRVAATAANGYAAFPTLNVEPGSVVHLSALVRVEDAATTAELQLYDVTNSAALTPQNGTSLTSDRLYDVRLAGTFAIPSTCDQVSVRLVTQTNAKNTEWNDVDFHAVESQSIALPWWVTDSSQVLGVFRLDGRQLGGSNPALLNPALVGQQIFDYDFRDSISGRGQLSLVTRERIGTRSLFIFGKRNETAFATDNSDVKHINENYLVAALAVKVFEQIARFPESSPLDSAWVDRELAGWRDVYKKERYAQAKRLEQQAPAPRGDMLIGGSRWP